MTTDETTPDPPTPREYLPTPRESLADFRAWWDRTRPARRAWWNRPPEKAKSSRPWKPIRDTIIFVILLAAVILTLSHDRNPKKAAVLREEQKWNDLVDRVGWSGLHPDEINDFIRFNEHYYTVMGRDTALSQKYGR